MQADWKVVGHRGYAAQYPENTLPGFEAALTLGVDAIEMDIQLTRDGIPVVLHDFELERTTDGRGSLATLSFADLERISCHFPARFGEKFAPLGLQSLEQLSAALANSQAYIFIEIKKESIGQLSREDYLDAVLQASHSLGDRRIIISFDEKLVALARAQSTLATGWCLEDFSATTCETANILKPDMLICSSDLPRDQPLWVGPWEWFVYGIETVDEARYWAERGARWIEADDPSAVMPRNPGTD